MGRHIKENSKDYMLRVRMNKDTLEKLDECCEIKKTNRSEIVRECIEDKFNDIKN